MELGILTLLPPVCAIVLAVVTKNVIPSLFVGVWLGATMLHHWNPLIGLNSSFSDFVIPSMSDKSNATVLLYVGLFGVLISVLQKSGGAQAIAHALSAKARNAKGAQGFTWLFGVIIFFEDYFNALTVGPVMRPVTDKLKVSREKLAYIVDSTSAPMTLLGPVSTWVVFVMGLLGEQFAKLDISRSEYLTYLSTIPFNFYAILALIMVLVIAFTRLEFGPMAKAEHRARTTGKVIRDGARPPSGAEVTETESVVSGRPKMRNMIVPLIILVGLIPPMFLWTGGFGKRGFISAIGHADGGQSILIAAFVSGLVALAMGVRQKLFKIGQVIDIYISGIKGMALVYIILILAWSIGNVTSKLGTADYVVGLAKQVNISMLIPALLFIVAAIIAFTTGTSYGTFAIMIPIALPVASELDLPMGLMIAAVFSGGIFGDHCSPISDTTILSSSGSGSDHIDHVNTQLPYAATAAAAALLAFVVAGWTGSAIIALPVGVAFLVILLFGINKIWLKIAA